MQSLFTITKLYSRHCVYYQYSVQHHSVSMQYLAQQSVNYYINNSQCKYSIQGPQSVNYYINNSQCKYSKYAIPRTAVSKLLH